MANPINGRSVVLYKYDAETATDIPFACALDCALSIQTESKETTSQTSAWFREYTQSFTTWQISVNGLLILNDSYNYLYILDAIKNRETFLIKFVIDNGGVLGLSIFSGSVMFSTVDITSPDGSLANYSASMLGSGAYSTSGTIITPGGVVIISGTATQIFQAVATDGQTSITFAGAVGLDLLYCSAGSMGIQPIGALTGNGCVWNTLTGGITFATPRADGEAILIMVQ